MSLKRKFVHWLLNDSTFKIGKTLDADIDAKIKEGLGNIRGELYEINRTYSSADDERWKQITILTDKIHKRVDLFFERQHCTLCGEIASVCEKDKSH